MRARDAGVGELVAHRLPRLTAVVGALDQLPEPAAGLRRIQPIRISGRSREVVDLPARKVGTTDVPPLAVAVRRQDERTLAGPRQYPYPGHLYSLLSFAPVVKGSFVTTSDQSWPSPTSTITPTTIAGPQTHRLPVRKCQT